MAKKADVVTPPGVEGTGRTQDTETAQAPVNVAEREPEEVFVPKVTSSSRGKISATLEGIATEFKRLYPSMECRWVFHSARKPELSNVISRMSEGYAMIAPSEFNGEYPIEPFIDEKQNIRLADVVLMKIPAGQRKVNRIERQRLADSQLTQVKEGFHAAMSQVSSGKHQAVPRGGLKMEERDHDLNYTQPDSKE